MIVSLRDLADRGIPYIYLIKERDVGMTTLVGGNKVKYSIKKVETIDDIVSFLKSNKNIILSFYNRRIDLNTMIFSFDMYNSFEYLETNELEKYAIKVSLFNLMFKDYLETKVHHLQKYPTPKKKLSFLQRLKNRAQKLFSCIL